MQLRRLCQLALVTTFVCSLAGGAAAQAASDGAAAPASSAASAPSAAPVAATPAPPKPPTTCADPRSAVDSVFAWQQPGRLDLDQAARCLELPRGASAKERHAAARIVKEVYDGRALYVDVPAISDDPAHVDPATGRASVVPHPDLAGVVVERQADGQWRWTRASIEALRGLHGASWVTWVDDHLPAALRGRVLGVALWQYLALMLAVGVGLIARRILHFLATRKLAALQEGARTRWVATLVDTIASPGATLVVAGVLRVVHPQLGLPLGASLIMDLVVRTIVVLTLVWVGYRLVDVFAEWLSGRARVTSSKLDDQLVPLVRKTAKVIVVVVGGLLVLQNMDVDVGSLLAGLGIGGLAFALAAKDTVANLFGSIMIFVDQPFQIGDWVSVDGCEGIVEEVGFRSTRIRAFDNALVTIPNMKFTEQKIVNFGARKYRRCSTTLQVTYDTKPAQLQAFVEGVRGIVLSHPHCRKDAFEIHVSGFGAHSIDVMLYFFFDVRTWSDELAGRHDVMLSIMRLAEELGVAFAFPTQTLHVVEVAAPGASRQVAPPPPDATLADLARAFGPEGQRGRPTPSLLEGAHLPGSAAPRGAAKS